MRVQQLFAAVARLMLLLAAAAAAAPTCDYRLVEESKYSAFSLHGLSTTKSICMNDYFSTSHADMTLLERQGQRDVAGEREGPAVRRAADGAARLARGRANRAEAVPVVSPRPLSAVRIE